MPNIVSQGTGIPWPGGTGTTGSIDLHNYMSGIAGQQANRTPTGYSGAYLALKNDSDSTLLMTWDVSKTSFHLIAGEPITIPIRQQDTKLNWTVVGQNTAQAHTAEMLYSTFIDPTDVAAGYPITGGSIVNPSTPAASIGPGPLPEGVTIEADDIGVGPTNETFGVFAFLNPVQVNAGTFPAGVIEPAAQVGAGTLASNVFLSIINSDGGKITSDGVGNLTIALGGALNTPRVNYQGTLSASNKIQDLQQGYQYFSDNTAALGTTRNWLDGPDRGELQLGPRTGANYFDWIRLRATKVTLDLGHNASANPIKFEVTGGHTELDNNAIHSDGSGNLTAVSFTGNVAPSNITTGALPESVTIGADDITAENLASGVKQQNGSTIAGLNSAGGGAAGTQIWVGTTDPGGSAAEGDIWFPI